MKLDTKEDFDQAWLLIERGDYIAKSKAINQFGLAFSLMAFLLCASALVFQDLYFRLLASGIGFLLAGAFFAVWGRIRLNTIRKWEWPK